MATEWVTVRVSAELKARIDEVRGHVPFARWVGLALEERLDEELPSGPPLSPAESRELQMRANAAQSAMVELRNSAPAWKDVPPLPVASGSDPEAFKTLGDHRREASEKAKAVVECPHRDGCDWVSPDVSARCPVHDMRRKVK